MGIEPTSEAWEASILPLYDARSFPLRVDYTQRNACQYRPRFLIFRIDPARPKLQTLRLTRAES